MLNNLIKTIAGREKVGFIDLLLTFLTTVLLVLALVFNRLEVEGPLGLTGSAVLIVAGVLAATGVIVALLELRRPQRLRGSRGVLMLWSGLLAALSVFTVPVMARNLLVTPTLIAVAGGTSEGTAEATADALPRRETEAATEAVGATATLQATGTPTSTRTPTATRTPRPTATATPTRERFRFDTPTPEPTPTLPNPCIGLVLYNLRLRVEPDHEAETLLTIPYDTTITIYGRNADSSWWYVIYDDQTGWVDGEFMEVSSSCADVPVQPVR
mgnify:CR=1 FL=1